MQQKNFPIGIGDFKEVIQTESVFVDKSLFIKDIMENGAKAILITRPRRFGKTMNMSMLSCFLDINEEKSLFYGLKIEKETEFCKKHQNKYPVIFLSFKDAKFDSFDEAVSELREVFSKLYEQHVALLEDHTLSDTQKEIFNKILDRTSDVSDLTSALSDLTRYMHKKHGIPPILLLDEYDTPIHSAYTKGYYDKLMNIMRPILSKALKDNPNLGKAVLTGIFRISKESLFSGLNNLEVHSILDDLYAPYFGFTEEEVISLLPPNLSIEPIRNWYNGYTIGDLKLYNPWSIMNCFKKEGKLGPYWLNTSDNALVYSLIGQGNLKLKLQFELLIEGKHPEQAIQENLTFNYLDNNNDAIWTLLLHAGYLNVISKELDNRGHFRARIAIPNQEIMCIYNDLVSGWFVISGIDDYQEFLDALVTGNIRAFRDHIATYLTTTCSYFDFSSSTPEHVFHVFMLGLLVGFQNRFEVTSNRESGFGRYDVILNPMQQDDPGIILEFKTCKTPERLEEVAREALTQIETQKYDARFKTQNTLKVGLAFCGKQVVAAYTTGDQIIIHQEDNEYL